MFREKESVPAMSIAALEKKYHCVIEIKDKNEQSATAGHRRHAGIIIIIIIIIFFFRTRHFVRHFQVAHFQWPD